MTPFGPLVNGDWLAAHQREVRIVDSRWYLDGRSGRAAYDAGHIPGAVWVDLDLELSDPPSKEAGRHPLPSPERFAASMQRLGVDADTPVVVYDDAAGSIAARLWWLLHVLDHPVAVLDGGIAAWPGDSSVDDPVIAKGSFSTRAWPPQRFAAADDLAGASVLLDARAASRYAHGDPKVDPRPGHIPGALNAPWAHNTSDGKLKAASELDEQYRSLGCLPGTDVVAYCGSGVTACHDLLALEVAGLGQRSRLYPGSFSQWGASDRPVVSP